MPKRYANVVFEPDLDLVVKVAEWLSDRPKSEAFMVTARELLVFLVKLGMGEQSDGKVAP